MTYVWVLEAVVALVAVVQVARVVTKPVVRREIRDHPGQAGPMLAAACVVCAALAWTAAAWPLVRHALAAVLAAGLLASWWRARPAYGRGRGLPPGSLGLGQSLDAITDRRFYFNQAARFGPVFKMSQFGRPVVCSTDLPLAVALLETQRDAVRQVDWPFDRLIPGGYVEFMDGDRHTRFRELLRPGFGDSVLEQCRPTFQRIVQDALDALAQRSGPGGVDPAPFVERIALGCLLRVVLGVHADGPRAAEIPRLLAVLDRPIGPFIPVPAGMRRAFERLSSLVREVGEAARQESTGNPRPASVLSEVVRVDPALAQDAQVIGNLVTMVHDGRTMLRRLLLWILKLGGDHPRWTAQIRAAADGAAPAAADELARLFVLETLRMRMTPYIYRKVVRDLRLGPYRVPRGWLLRICVREAHRRPEVFASPDAFEPSRFAARSFGPDEFCPFSAGPHACFADTFVMAVARTFLVHLALNYDERIARDGPVEGSNRHWTYGQPGVHLRVSLTPRGSPPSPASKLVPDDGATA